MNVINFFGVASFSKKPEKYGQGIGLWAFFEKWYAQFWGGGGWQWQQVWEGKYM